MIFGHFIYFGHFPIEIPIEAEKIYHHGKELSYRENKMCSETSEAVGTIWEHAQKEFQNFLKIRITLLPHSKSCFTFFSIAHNATFQQGLKCRLELVSSASNWPVLRSL